MLTFAIILLIGWTPAQIDSLAVPSECVRYDVTVYQLNDIGMPERVVARADSVCVGCNSAACWVIGGQSYPKTRYRVEYTTKKVGK